MGHFAEIKKDTNEVIRVIVVGNDDIDAHGGDYSESAEQWVASFHPNDLYLLNNKFNGVYPETYWKQTSIHVARGVHSLGKTPIRKNPANVGSTYDKDKDAFIPPKLYNSWVFNEEICCWEPPIPEPTIKTYGENSKYVFYWDEENIKWLAYDENGNEFEWISSSFSWLATGKALQI